MAEIPDALDIGVENICRVIVKARQFAAKEGVVEDDYGGNQVDEGFREVLATHSDDPVFQELKSFIDGLDIDAQCELVALMWIGRGDFSKDEWDAAIELAQEEHTEHTAEYLLGTPLLPDLLQAGLDAYGLSCTDFEEDHL
jgi:hypothetical protein